MVLLVRQQRPLVAGDAVGLAGEKRQAPLLRGVQRGVVAAHVAVEGRVGLHQRALERGDGHVGVADVGPVVAEDLLEPPPVLGHEGEPRLHHVVLAVARHRAAGGGPRLGLQRPGRPRPEELAVVGRVDDGLAVAPVYGAGIARADGFGHRPAGLGKVADGARHGVVAREDGIEEQQLAELDLLRRHRVVRGDRGRTQGSQPRRSLRARRRGRRQHGGRRDDENRSEAVHGHLPQFGALRQFRTGL